MKKSYKCIFFDLDHTLWDFEVNSCEALREIYSSYSLSSCGVTDCDAWLRQFKKVNLQLWDMYDRGLIDSETIRQERFKQILGHFNIFDEKLCCNLSSEYLDICPKKSNLIPYAVEILEYLVRKYLMTIVTNGFDEVQHIKMTAGNLHGYFQHVVTSQKAGYKKPSREIFEFAMKANSVVAEEVIMIGDNLMTDVGGAINASIDTVFFNPGEITHTVNVKHEIRSLAELQNIL